MFTISLNNFAQSLTGYDFFSKTNLISASQTNSIYLSENISSATLESVLNSATNPDCNANLFLDTLSLYSGNYKAGDTLISKNTVVPESKVGFSGGKAIELHSHFEIPAGATLDISIKDCNQVTACCLEDPLAEPFLQSYITGVVGYKIFQATNNNGDCLFRVNSDYSSSCEITLSDLPSYFYDCEGNQICYYGGFTINPVNICLDLFNTDFRDLDWKLIFSCDMQ